MQGLPDEGPLENLRFFLSCALSGQDWLGVEPFLDALTPAPTPIAQDSGPLEDSFGPIAQEGAADRDDPVGMIVWEDLFKLACSRPVVKFLWLLGRDGQDAIPHETKLYTEHTVATLRAQLAYALELGAESAAEVIDARAQLATSEARVGELEKDAARYRLLRASGGPGAALHVRGEWSGYLGDFKHIMGDELDARLDSALSQPSKPADALGKGEKQS
jgi:hypothetical protein